MAMGVGRAPAAGRAGRMTSVLSDQLMALGMVIIRVGFGLVFLTNGVAKLPGFGNKIPPFKGFLIGYDGARSILEADTAGHPVAPYKWLVDNVLLAHFSIFGPLVTVTEIGVGLLLVLGAFTPLAALVGFTFIAHLQFANIHRGDKWLWEYAIEWMPLLSIALLRAGRYWGVDSRLARRFPWWPVT